MTIELQASFIQSNGIRFHVVQAGPEDGPPVFLLHGFPEYWGGWKKQIGPLAQAGYRVSVPDQRGYNLSDKPAGLSAYRVNVLSDDIAGLIQALGYPKATLVGHDWGGVVAWVTAAMHPNRVEKLAALNAPYPHIVLKNVLRHPQQILKSAYMYYFQIPGLPEAMLRNNNWELLVQSMRSTSRPGTFTDEDFKGYREAWWRKGAMTGMLNWYRALFQRPPRLPVSPRLDLPVLLLWGKQDRALSKELATASIAQCSNGRLEFFEEATHWVQHEEPDKVSARLLEFFRE